jgi:Putative amidase domain/IPT/TIG domain
MRRASIRSRTTVFVATVAAAVLLLTGCATSSPSNEAAGTAAASPLATAATAVRAVSPATGGVTGANTVTVRGTGLGDVKSVTFGGQAATIAKGATATKITALVPAALNYQPATVDVALLDAKGATVATLTGGYSYQVVSPVDRQMQYALQYWQNYNTATYGNLNPVGGDCANFVSQTLVARGLQMNSSWYNHNAAASWSPAWGYVPAMDNYFAANAKTLGLTEYPLSDRANIKLGDIIIFDWNNNNSPDHVEVVTKIIHDGSQIKIEAASHNDDFSFRDLDETITVTHPGAVGHFWSFNS